MKILENFALGLIATVSFCSDAAAFCFTPTAPSCASQYGAFDDEDEFDRCKREMASYLSDVEQYTGCQKGIVDEAASAISAAEAQIAEAKSENDRQLGEYGEAVDAFNRRARGY